MEADLPDQVVEVGQPDEVPVLADLGVRQAQPNRQSQRVGDDPQDEDRRRCQQQQGLNATPVGACEGRDYPLTAPAVSPATKWSTKKE
jgi:hypothetical protein